MEDADPADPLYFYGTDKALILKLSEENPLLAEKLHPSLEFTKAEVVFAARSEMARTVEDVLARRVERSSLMHAQVLRWLPLLHT